MRNSEILDTKVRNVIESCKANPGKLVGSEKTFSVTSHPHKTLEMQIAKKGLRAFSEAQQRIKLDPFRQLTTETQSATLATKNKNYSVSLSNDEPIPYTKDLITSIKTDKRKVAIHRELEETVQKKELEKAATTLAKDAALMGDLNAQIQAKDLLNTVKKKNVLDDVDDTLFKIHCLLQRMTEIVQNKLSDVQKRLEARTARIEDLTSFSNELTKELGKKDGGAINWKDDPQRKAHLDRIRNMEFLRSDGRVEKLALPDGDEWTADQVTSARQVVDTQKSSMQNMSKKDELEVSSESTRYNTYLQMRSSLIARWGDVGKGIARAISGR